MNSFIDDDDDFFSSLPEELMNRFDFIMARIDEWAEESAGWDCRAEVMNDVRFMLENANYADYTDEQIIEEGIASWMEHE